MISLILVLPMVLLAQGTSVGRVERNELDAVGWKDGEASLNAPERENEDSRIIGGRPAVTAPSYASIRRLLRHMCGASIITDQWVLTAAHCTVGMKATQLTIVVGLLSKTGKNNGTAYKCDKIINHEDYNSKNLAHDLAVLKSSEKFVLSASVAIICLATELPKDNTATEVCGMGYTQYPLAVTPNDLQCLNTTTISIKDCKKAHERSGPAGNQITVGQQICTLTAKGEGACKGDSGGPLTVIIGDIKCQIGIVSWGVPCGKGYPDVFRAVPFYLQWIKENAK